MPQQPRTGLPVHVIDTNAGATEGGILAVERIDDVSLHAAPHRHSFTQVIFIESGTGAHLIDFERVPLRAGDLHVIAPGQVHAWDVSDGPQATAAMFSETALDTIGPLPDRLRGILLFGAAPIPTDDAARRRIPELLATLARTGGVESGTHLMLALLWECFYADQAHSERRGTEVSSSLTRSFMRIALAAPSAGRSVSGCAAELGVTPSHLTEQLLAETGMTPGRLLRTALAREAQRLLTGTELTAAQISDALGFSAPSYFSRFFLREVGCTPSAYRRIPPSARPTIQR